MADYQIQKYKKNLSLSREGHSVFERPPVPLDINQHHQPLNPVIVRAA